MRVFVTGATGFIGAAVVSELIGAGHQVLGLARSDASAKALAAAGGQVHRGDVEDLESLRSGAAQCDGVIHTAFIHDFSKFAENCAIDRRAIEALGDGLAGTGRPFIVTTGTGIAAGRACTEDDPVTPSAFSPRSASDEAAAAVAVRGARVSMLCLPRSVHDPRRHGLVSLLLDVARQTGVSAYAGEGLNRWPAVHQRDAARLYLLALEKGVAGARYHAVDEDGLTMRDIAAAVGAGLKVPVVAKSPADASAHFGAIAAFVGLDCPASSTKTQAALNWRPTHAKLAADLERVGELAA